MAWPAPLVWCESLGLPGFLDLRGADPDPGPCHYGRLSGKGGNYDDFERENFASHGLKLNGCDHSQEARALSEQLLRTQV